MLNYFSILSRNTLRGYMSLGDQFYVMIGKILIMPLRHHIHNSDTTIRY